MLYLLKLLLCFVIISLSISLIYTQFPPSLSAVRETESLFQSSGKKGGGKEGKEFSKCDYPCLMMRKKMMAVFAGNVAVVVVLKEV